MKYFLLVLALAAVSCNAVYEQDMEILRKCLAQVSHRSGPEQWRKIARYSSWTVEEIPCITRCIAIEKGWFHASTNLWSKQRIVDDLGADMYNYCRYELDRAFDNGCDFAHKGLRCLKQAEEYTSKTYTTLLQCAHELDANQEQLQHYAQFPAQEEIPCLFKCFAEKMNFYTPEYEWNFENWIKAFGPVRQANSDTSAVCKTNVERIKQVDKCVWMYDEYICLERLNYNTDGSASRFVSSAETTTTMSTSTSTMSSSVVSKESVGEDAAGAENTTEIN